MVKETERGNKMKKQRTSYEQAVIDYKNLTGEYPTFNQITSAWHGYASEWKHFNGFTDWLIYHQEV